ncbi:MAG: glycosyltransferase family 4 protein [Planctomycetaceae bacterium]
MRITWISYDFPEYSIRQVNALAQEHEVLLVMTSEVEDRLLCELDGSVALYSFERPRLRQPLRQCSSIRRIVRRIHEFRPDVVHFQNGHLWFNFALPMLSSYPLVITIHDPRHHEGDAVSRKTPQAVMDFGFRRADHVIVHGQNLVETVAEEIGIRRDRIHVIPHVAMGETAARVVVPEDNRLVLFFGRIWEYKGLEYLIRAAPLVAREIPEARFLIAGRGENFERYLRLMEHPEQFLVHNKWIGDEQRAEMFQRSAVVVLPYISATQSGVVPVAYTYGKPVVATSVGALPECVDHGRTGLLVPPCDQHALADAIVTLLRDDGLRREMGENGLRKLQQEWSAEVVAEMTAEVYECAIRDRRLAREKQPA